MAEVSDEQTVLRGFYEEAKQAVRYHRAVHGGGIVRAADMREPKMELNTAHWMLDIFEQNLEWVWDGRQG